MIILNVAPVTRLIIFSDILSRLFYQNDICDHLHDKRRSVSNWPTDWGALCHKISCYTYFEGPIMFWWRILRVSGELTWFIHMPTHSLRSTLCAPSSLDTHSYQHSHSRLLLTIGLILCSWPPAIPITGEFSQTKTTTYSTLRARQPDEFTNDISSYLARYFAKPLYWFSLVFDLHPDKRYLQYSRSEAQGSAIQISVHFGCFRGRWSRLSAFATIHNKVKILWC
jgi:hypothetical protein